MQIATAGTVQQAAAWLMEHDPALRPVITRVGLCTIRPHQEYYRSLVYEIIGQQLHVKAADSIRRKFEALFGGTFPAPAVLLAHSVEDLRMVGLSRAKAAYIRDIAQHCIDNKIDFASFDTLRNEQIIAILTDVKGIGEWTAHMFLMFCMARLDVLPVGDLGIRNGVRKLYGLAEMPTPQQVAEVAAANRWHPYESIASWYIWQALDAASSA